MMQQDVVTPKFLKQVFGLRRQTQFARGKAAVLKIRALGLFVNIEQAR